MGGGGVMPEGRGLSFSAFTAINHAHSKKKMILMLTVKLIVIIVLA